MNNNNNVQDMFKVAERNIEERLDGIPVLGSYKEMIKQIVNIDGDLFEMLYSDDANNTEDYDIDFSELEKAYENLEHFQN